MVTTYIREECDKLPHLSKSLNPDLKAIAIDGSPQNIIKVNQSHPSVSHHIDEIQLVKAILLAAMYSDVSNERMVTVMQSLGADVAMPIAQSIEEMENLDQKLGDMGADTETGSDMDHSTDSEGPSRNAPPLYERDPELEREEKLIKALQEKRVLENRILELSDDLKEAQDKCHNLEEELAESKFTLDRRRRTTMDEQDLQQLNLQAGRDKDYIAELETDLANATTTIDQQERQIEKLKADDNSKQELKDELQLVKAERDELRQKSKVNENLKKKIQALQEHEKANTNLRRELQSTQEQLQEVDAIRDRCAALEKANDENAQTIANGEQEIFDQKTAKRRIEHELKVLEQRFEQTRDMLSNAQETIKDLEDRVQDVSSTRDSTGDINNLDAELNADDASIPENGRTQDKKPRTPTSSAETIVLQQNLSIATASVARLEQRCLDLFQENLGFKSDIDEAGDINSAHPFQHQARRLEAMSKELDEIQSKYIASTTEIIDLKRRLKLSEDPGKSILSLVRHIANLDTPANGDQLAQSDELLSQNHERQKYTEELATQLREHRSLLRHALLSNESLQKEEEAIRKSNEYKIIRLQLEAVREAVLDEAEATMTGAATNLTEKIESGRIAISEREKVRTPSLQCPSPLLPDHLLTHPQRLNDQGTQLASISSELQQLKSQPRPPVPPPKDHEVPESIQQELSNLQRENKLIASAWYDLTARLQSNTVMLARRQEMPRSWIGKQRAVVGGGGVVSGYFP
jgi:protein HOOK3